MKKKKKKLVTFGGKNVEIGWTLYGCIPHTLDSHTSTDKAFDFPDDIKKS